MKTTFTPFQRGLRAFRPRLILAPQILFLVVLPAFLQLHLSLRLLEGGSLRWDECEQALFTQQLELGYNDQPPVYTWLLRGLMQLTGVSLVGVYLFKSLILGGIYLALYGVSRRLMPDTYAVPATLSLLLTPYFAWSAMMDGAHTPFVTLFAPLLLLVALRLLDRQTTGNFLLLGLVLGFGFLAKYSFLLLAVALPGAMLTIPAYRNRLRNPRLLLSLAVAALIVLPHTAWVLEHWKQIRARPMERSGVDAGGDFLGRTAGGLGSLGLTLLLTAGPLFGVLLMFFRRALVRILTHRAATDEVRLLGRWLAVVGGILLLLILLGVTRFRTHWLIPILVILPAYVFARATEVRRSKTQMRLYLGLVVVAIFLVVGWRVGRIAYESGEGGKEWARDRLHNSLSARVHDRGLERATFVGDNPIACGNLRLRNPHARVACLFYPAFVPADPGDDSPCYFLWDATCIDRPVPASQFWLQSHGFALDESDVFFAEVPAESRERNLRRIGMIRLRRD
jgi:4-amino-4-deoxy-L-arabinose transferase-like glycosyltransferase